LKGKDKGFFGSFKQFEGNSWDIRCGLSHREESRRGANVFSASAKFGSASFCGRREIDRSMSTVKHIFFHGGSTDSQLRQRNENHTAQ
jgi:hypothetical protein